MDDGAAMWRNGVTNTAIVVDMVRKKHAKALRRNAAFAAFDRDLNDTLDRWFRATRAADPQTYGEAEAVFKDLVTPVKD